MISFSNSPITANLSEYGWVAIDLETTGINPWKYEIIEIGAVKFNINGIEDRYNVVIKPEKKHDPKSRSIHNITDDEINTKGILLEEGIFGLCNFIENYPLIFHNASFDLSFLKLACEKVNCNIPTNLYYDTLYLLRTYKPDLESYSLSYLQNFLNLPGTLHRALDDAEITSYIFSWLLSDFSFKLTSKKNIKSFLRYHRKFSEFEITLPKNLDRIISYFNKFITSKSLIKVHEIGVPIYQSRFIIPMEIMIFNQNLMLKCKNYPGEQIILLPLRNYTFLDPDQGEIKISNL